MPQPRVICKHCGAIFKAAGFDFPDRQSLEESDLLDVRTFCPFCEQENIWNKDEVVNIQEFPKKQPVSR